MNGGENVPKTHIPHASRSAQSLSSDMSPTVTGIYLAWHRAEPLRQNEDPQGMYRQWRSQVDGVETEPDRG
jgi:hypothetical protein